MGIYVLLTMFGKDYYLTVSKIVSEYDQEIPQSQTEEPLNPQTCFDINL